MRDDGRLAFSATRIYDGEAWHRDASLLVENGKVTGIGKPPDDLPRTRLGDVTLVPGFIDLQVNGGGGHLIGADTTIDKLRLVCDVHARFGVTGLLPTLVTSSDATIDSILAAGVVAARSKVPGFLGLHLEGPHLSVERRGAHDASLIRPMLETDIVRLERAREALPNLVLTVAAETVAPEIIARLVRAGVIVSIGHSDASYDVAQAAFKAGASMATHLFNAMSQLGSRNPGVVGAALESRNVYAGIIADGIHVHKCTAMIARAAKRGPGKLFLVSDSMHQAGTDLVELPWNDRTIYRKNGALRLQDGTLAGADLTMVEAVAGAQSLFGVSFEVAIAMGSADPASAISLPDSGHLTVGFQADFTVLSPMGRVVTSARGGELISSW